MKGIGLIGVTIVVGFFYFSNTQKSERLSYFKDGEILHINIISQAVVHKNHIGDNWENNTKIENTLYYEGDKIQIDLSGKSELKIISNGLEIDPSYDDTGYSALVINPDNIDKLIQDSPIKEIVKVKEHHGPSANNVATCEFIYELSF